MHEFLVTAEWEGEMVTRIWSGESFEHVLEQIEDSGDFGDEVIMKIEREHTT